LAFEIAALEAARAAGVSVPRVYGDSHPGRLMLSGDRYAAFDWSGAKRGDPLFDYA